MTLPAYLKFNLFISCPSYALMLIMGLNWGMEGFFNMFIWGFVTAFAVGVVVSIVSKKAKDTFYSILLSPVLGFGTMVILAYVIKFFQIVLRFIQSF